MVKKVALLVASIVIVVLVLLGIDSAVAHYNPGMPLVGTQHCRFIIDVVVAVSVLVFGALFCLFVAGVNIGLAKLFNR